MGGKANELSMVMCSVGLSSGSIMLVTLLDLVRKYMKYMKCVKRVKRVKCMKCVKRVKRVMKLHIECLPIRWQR